MSKIEPKISVVLKQHSKKIMTAMEAEHLNQAMTIASILNGGLEQKARDLGYKYVVKVEA